MSILDVIALFRRYMKYVLIILAAGVLVFAVYAVAKPAVYSATSTVVCSIPPKIAAECAEGYTRVEGASVSIEVDSKEKEVRAKAQARKEEDAIRASNYVTFKVYADAKEKYADATFRYDEAVSATVSKANPLAYAISGFFAAFLFVCACFVLLAVRGSSDAGSSAIEKAWGVPCLGSMRGSAGKKQYAALYQAIKENVTEQAIVPVLFLSDSKLSHQFAQRIKSVAQIDAVKVGFATMGSSAARREFSRCEQKGMRCKYIIVVDKATYTKQGQSMDPHVAAGEAVGFVLL